MLLRKLVPQTIQTSLKGSFLYIALAALLMGAAIPLGIMQYGLDNPVAVGPYLDGNLPSTGGSSWDVVDAFPNLTFDDPLQIIEIPHLNKFLIAGKYGVIWWIVNNDTTTSTKNVVLDITTDVYSGGDTGLLGIATHPKFGKGQGKDYLYVWYRHRQLPGSAQKAYLRLVRYDLDPVTFVANTATAFVMINQYDRHQWHNGGGMFFDDEGYLYISVGDEGGAEDEFNNGQKIDEGLLSGILRIDVDMDPSRSHPIRRQPLNPDTLPHASWPDSYSQGYYIPDDNPWQSPDSSHLEEFYAIGLRSPHRISYDSVDGYIFVGDIGQGSREEISLVEKGSNLQWPYKEGELGGFVAKPDSLIGIDTSPFFDYARSMGTSVIGGMVYRGTKFPALYGKYIFGDHTVRRVWALDPLTSELDYLAVVPEFGVGSKAGISSFYYDTKGEVYVTKLYGTSADGGKIYKLIEATAPDPAPATLSLTGAFSDLTNMTPENYVIPYDMNVPFWSDNAKKYRWLVVPNDGTHNTSDEKVTYRQYDAFDWPIGTVFIKHFEYQTDDQNPNSIKKLETRFMVKGSDENYYGLTYKWRDDQTDADLQTVGLLDTLAIQTTLGPREIHWYYPGQQECAFCHNESAGGVLGPKSIQLNMDIDYPLTGRTANQLKTLSHLGIFEDGPDTSALADLPVAIHGSDTEAPLETRVKSYLDANCAYCHRPNTSIRANFDARFKTPMGAMNLIMGELEHPKPDESENRAVVPGKPDQSMLYRRLEAVHDEISMPPLAKNLMDSAGVALIEEWILNMDDQEGVSDLYEGRIAYYDFEGSYRDLIGDADGVSNNGASIVNDAERGQVLSTDGVDDFVSIDYKPQLYLGDKNADYSVAFWFKLRAGYTGQFRPLMQKGDRRHIQTFAFWMDKNSNQISYKASSETNAYDGGTSDTELTLNKWTHIVCVKDGDKLYLYLDGEFEGLTTLESETLPNDDVLYIGDTPYNDPVDAAFDDLMIYNRALTADEAAMLAQESQDNYRLAHWPLNNDGKEIMNNADAILLNNPSFEDDAERGKVLSLDGTNDFLMAKHQQQLEVGRSNKPFSVSFWMNLKEDHTGQKRTLIKKGNTTLENNFILQLNETNNKILYQISTINGLEGTTSNTELSLNTWYHIGYSFDGSMVSLFIDGTLDGSFTPSDDVESNTGPIYFGDDPWNDPVKALMDDIKILNKAISSVDLGKEMLDTKPFAFGNDVYTAGTLDVGSANLIINKTDIFTNNMTVPVEVEMETFRFYAQRLGNPITPFVAKYNAGNFEVLAIGSTRTSSEYKVGANRFDFIDGDIKKITLQPGESLYPGYIDANPDGSGDGINSIVPYETSATIDDVWYTGGLNGSESAQISEGSNVVQGASTSNISRNYKFLIEATVLGSQSIMNQTIEVSPVSNASVSDASVDLQVTSTFGMPLTYTLVDGPATLEGPKVMLNGSPGLVTIEASQEGNEHLNAAPTERIAFFVTPVGNNEGTGTGLTATYYNDTSRTNQVLSRVDSQVNFTWGSKAPDPVVNPLTFSVVWEGEIESPFSEQITFKTSTDDGVRLWVDGNLIIDSWTDQSVSTFFGTVNLTAWDKVPIKMEYYQNQVYAEAHLYWSSNSMPEEVVPTSFLYPLNTSLPIELVEFNVELIGQEARLDWLSSNEVGASHYTIERSFDAQVFQALVDIDVQGRDNSATYYEWIDSEPTYGENYYRLKMVDLDGSFTYSAIKSVNLQGDQLWVYPNPGKIGNDLMVSLAFNNAKKAHVMLMDLSGRKIRSEEWDLEEGKTLTRIPTADLAPGGYLLVATGPDGTQLIRKILLSK